MSATLTTDVDLSKINLIIPKTVMQEIGVKFRVYRHNVVMSRRQMHDLSAMKPLKAGTIKQKREKGSAYPDLPLVDTGNMTSAQALVLDARDGYLGIDQGPTRAEIAAYHNEGAGKLPQRVHLSFNEEFINRELHQSIEMWIDRVFKGLKKVA